MGLLDCMWLEAKVVFGGPKVGLRNVPRVFQRALAW